jgi:hypothetical protein
VNDSQRGRISLHEDFSRAEEIRGGSDRSFGIVFAVVFAIVGAWPLRHGLPVRIWALGIAVAFLGIALAAPKILRPANRLWTKFGIVLQKLVNPVITALIFYLIFTPAGLVMRMLGKDSLRLRWDPQAPSYWIERRPAGPDPATMTNQF